MSAAAVGMQPWYPISVLPSGAIGDDERMAIAWSYNGNAAGAAPPAAEARSLILQLGGG